MSKSSDWKQRNIFWKYVGNFLIESKYSEVSDGINQNTHSEEKLHDLETSREIDRNILTEDLNFYLVWESWWIRKRWKEGRRRKESLGELVVCLKVVWILKHLGLSYFCFKHKGLIFSAFSWIREDLLSHSISLMKKIQNFFNCPSSRVRWETQNHDASDVALSKSFILI